MSLWLTWWDFGMLLVFLAALVIIHGFWATGGFKRRGVKSLPAYPIIGNSWNVASKKFHFTEDICRTYQALPNEKYLGVYQFTQPILLLRDIELIKQIAIKDFDHFQDRSNFSNENTDPLFAKNLLALRGQKWRDMRATLSPAFTSSKMKNMYVLIDECAMNMSNYYLGKMKENKNQGIGFVEVEMKDTFTRYTNDIIATSSFGIKVDSLSDQNNEFFTMGKKATNFTGVQLMKSLLSLTFPRFAKALKLQIFDSSISDFFRNLVNGQMKYREENNIIRPDMIHLLMEAKKGSLQYEKVADSNKEFSSVDESSVGQTVTKTKWDDDEIIAQALLFFFAGFDTSSTLLSFMAHELTVNPDIQKRLQEEVDETMETCKNKPSYTDIQNMKYMDMVVSETLRKWPPGPITDRLCMKSYTFPPSSSNAKPYEMHVGEVLWIPIIAIHYDPDYFPDPKKFDPDRFSEENKSKIKPFTYLPFGIGPRNCIGSRFALMQIKSVMVHMLSKFDFVMTPKTTSPLELDRKSFKMSPVGESWIGLKPRE